LCSASRVQASLTVLRMFFLCSLLSVCVSLPRAFSEEIEQKLKGFNERIIRLEKARRAVERGKIYLQDKSYEDARQEFTTALKLDADYLEARFCLALVERGAGNHKLSVENLKAVYQKNPDYKGLCLEFVRSYLALGDCSQAESWLQKYKERKPDAAKELRKLEREIKKCFAQREK
jgi:lipopolysaccharide biosynthesis regulator YciM